MTLSEANRIAWLSRWLAFAGLCLMGSTWKLWLGRSDFPQISLFRWAIGVPVVVDQCLAVVAAIALLLVLLTPSRFPWRGIALLVFAGAITGCVLLNQHRLQPWAYHFAVAAVVLSLARPQVAIRLLIWLTAGIYFHSAVSKLDYSFVVGHGQQLVDALLGNFGTTSKHWPESARRIAASLLPIGELAVAICVVLPPGSIKTGWWRVFARERKCDNEAHRGFVATCQPKRWAFRGSLVMHIALMLALGPWGLGHQPGVLFWNAYFIVQNWLLFATTVDSTATEETESKRTTGDRIAIGTVWVVLILPFLEPLGWCDHWPAWELYASHPENVAVFVHESRRDELSADLLQFVDQPRFETPWCRLRIDRWPLASLGAPIYPQDRFQLGVVLAIARRFALEDNIRVVIEGLANRWTGKRKERELLGTNAIENELKRFRLNAFPRE